MCQGCVYTVFPTLGSDGGQGGLIQAGDGAGPGKSHNAGSHGRKPAQQPQSSLPQCANPQGRGVPAGLEGRSSQTGWHQSKRSSWRRHCDLVWEDNCFWRLRVSGSDSTSGWETLGLSGISEPVSITEGYCLLLPRLLGHWAKCAEPAQPSAVALLMRNQKRPRTRSGKCLAQQLAP